MKIFLPLCTALLLLAVAATLPVAAAEKQTASLREEMESLFQHLERKLSLQVEDAALATARQERRLTELENELKQLREEGESADAERRQEFSAFAAAEADKVKAASDRYTSLISAGFTALGALAALSVILPIILGYFGYRSFDREAKSKLEEMNQKLAEMETLVAKGHQHEQELKQLLQDNEPPQEQGKFPADITKSAQKAVQKGVGVEALRGRAVLAQNAEDWRRACLYWEDVIKEDPSDKEAHFFLAQCRTFLGSLGDVSPEQRTLLWKQAEDFYRKELTGPPTAQQPNILIAYAVLRREQARYAGVNRGQHLYTEAEEFLRRSGAREDMYILSLRATIKRGLATLQSDPAKRAELCNEAEQLLLRARKLAPQEVNLIGLLAELKLQQAAGQSKPEKSARLIEEAEKLLFQAIKLAPQDAKSYVVLAGIKAKQANKQSDPARRVKLYKTAEQLLLRAGELAPRDAASYTALAGIKMEQAGKLSNLTEKSRLWAAAEQLLSKARELAPQDAKSYIVLAGLKVQQADDQRDSVERTRLLAEAEQLLLKAGKLAPQDAKSYIILAELKSQQAVEKSDPVECSRLRAEVEQLLIKVRRLAPQDVDILALLAQLTQQQATDQRDPAERMCLRAEAEQFLLRARGLDPKRLELLVMLATLKLEQVRDAAPEERDGLLAAAESYLDELLPQDSAQGLYNRACIAALRGQQERALELLEECRKAGMLPLREHLEKDKDMDSLRDLDAFREFLKRAYPDQPDDQADAPA